MGKQDVVKTRNIEDLERKYNFAQLLGLNKNIENTAKGLLKIENELNSILNTLVINLADVLDSQSDVSLWFYQGIPTLSNEPYINWSTPNEHEGDVYYDQNTGYVYQWNGVWEVNPNPDLIEAMAITNNELDTSTDHERKVFFDTPTIPYSNGDWWIKDDGSLFVCQISKNSGSYEAQDFISSSNYTDTAAEKIGEEIKVLKGTVTLMSESYAKFTDLATGGSTAIAGENISTGNIKSNNYVLNVSGMKIDLSRGTIDSKNFKTDEAGNIYLGNGAKVIGGDGLLTTILIPSGGNYETLGFSYYGINQSQYVHESLFLNVNIPENFKVTEAKVNLFHLPIQLWKGDYSSYEYTYARNIKLYKVKDYGMKAISYGGSSIAYDVTSSSETEITNAFGSGSYTPYSSNPSSFELKSVTSVDIKSQFTNSAGNTVAGKYVFEIRSNFNIGGVSTSNDEYYTACKYSGRAIAYLTITGYTTF